MKTDIEISDEYQLKPVAELLTNYVEPSCVSSYGKYRVKVSPSALPATGKLILVTAINPTPAGEGKTTVSIGLADGMHLNGKKVVLALREPSLGPVFGMKGGATGGGYAQIVPMQDINLHFNGDLHAITCSNNLLSALIDNHIQQGNALQLDPKRIMHHRCMDLNDRALRNIVIGLGKPSDGVTREEHFDITAASEVMAIFCLSRDLDDLKRRLGNIVIGYNTAGEVVTVNQLGAQDAMTILLKEALLPNVVQTMGEVPAIVHGGPFANIAHGCSSIIATHLARQMADYVITEAGFGADLGAEKFLDLKCRVGGFNPDAVVLVATVRALKMHGGIAKEDIANENTKALSLGLANLKRHIEHLKNVFHMNVVVAINRFIQDTEKEIKNVIDFADKCGVTAVCCNAWQQGGVGCTELAKVVTDTADKSRTKLKYCYELTDSVYEKVEKIAKQVYGAGEVTFTDEASKAIADFTKKGYGDLPVVFAKTQYSFSDDETKLGAPENFTVTIRNVILRAGAGFLVAVAGDIMMMPGLPKKPSALNMTIDKDSKITGLF